MDVLLPAALRPEPGPHPSRISWADTVPPQYRSIHVYFTDRGIEELEKRRGQEEVTFEWLSEALRTFVDLNPDFEVPVERLATWLARLDEEEEDDG